MMDTTLDRTQTLAEDTRSVSDVVGHDHNTRSTALADRRMETFDRLVDGLYHKLRSDLALLVARLEISPAAEVSDPEQPSHETTNFQQFRDISSSLTESFDRVTEIQRIFATPHQDISCQEAADRLGTLMHGATKWTEVSRSARIDFSSGPHQGGDFPLPVETLLDRVIPFLLELMAEAVASGSIAACCIRQSGEGYIRLEFEDTIIGHMPIVSLLSRLGYAHDIIESGFIGNADSPESPLVRVGKGRGDSCLVDFYVIGPETGTDNRPRL